MKMFRPTRLSLSETVDPLSANCNTCPLLLPHSHHQHHFYLLPPPPTFTPPVRTDPLTSFLCALSLSRALAKVQVSVGIYLISIFTFKFRFIEPAWQSPGVAGSRNHRAFSTGAPYYLGSVSQVSIESEDGKVAQCTLGMDGSLEDRKEAIRLRTTLSLCRIWSGVDGVY